MDGRRYDSKHGVGRVEFGTETDYTPKTVDFRGLSYALYIDPPLGRAGATEHEVHASGRKALIQRAVHIHPTVTELMRTMRGELKPLN